MRNSSRDFLWASFAIGAVLSVLAHVQSQDASTSVPVTVSRRPSLDTYTILQGNRTYGRVCNVDNATYLVKEKRCINDEHLFNVCSFVITPFGEIGLTQRLLLRIEITGTSTTAQTLKTNDGIVDAIVTFRSREEQVNGSLCQISSLEVYRGRDQAIEISHQGFSLSDNGTIEIHIDQLVYSFEDYTGELYRMNLSCSGGDLPESGCLFFKVAGTTNISEAKFNCTVPGTLSSQCSSTTSDNNMATTSVSATQEPTTLQPTSDSPTSFNVAHDLTTLIINASTLPPTGFFDGILVAVVSLMGGVTILIIGTATVVVCVVWFRNTRMGQNSTSHVHVAAQPQNQESDTIPSDCQSNPAYIHFGPTESSPAGLLSDNHTENPAYNINTQPTPHKEPTYEVIPLDTDRSPHTVQGAQNVHCDQNPAYIHVLGIHAEERLPTDQSPQCD